MSKIDCSVTVNFTREYNRMCKCEGCYECPANIANNGTDYDCGKLLYSCPEVAIEIVQRWSDEHPQKTRLDDLLEKYPKYRFYGSDRCPSAHPAVFGYCNACAECINREQTLRYCWNEPLVGGATGKAVE